MPVVQPPAVHNAIAAAINSPADVAGVGPLEVVRAHRVVLWALLKMAGSGACYIVADADLHDAPELPPLLALPGRDGITLQLHRGQVDPGRLAALTGRWRDRAADHPDDGYAAAMLEAATDVAAILGVDGL